MTLKTSTGPAERWLVLLSVCLAAMTMPLTFTGPAVALSRIAADLGGSPIALNWVTNAFMLTFGASLMAAGALADNHGRKRIFLAGLGLYVLASLGAMLAPDIVWFDMFRAAQGIGAAAAFAGGASALAQEFEGPLRLRAFSFLGTSFGIGLAFGPIASGLLISAFGWRSIFVLVAALAVAASSLGLRTITESRDPDATGLDWAGAGTFTIALALLTYGVLQAPQSGWADPLVVTLLAVAALFFAAFIVVERRVRRPMLDLTLFRFPRFVGVQFLAAAPAYGFVVLLVLLPIRFIGIEGMSEIKAGQLMICLSGPLLILPLLAGQLARWIAPATICGVGPAHRRRRPRLAEPDTAGRHRAGRAAGADRHRHRFALGIDGRAGRQRRAEGTRRHGGRHLQHHARRLRGCGGGHRHGNPVRLHSSTARRSRSVFQGSDRSGAVAGDRQCR